jgi:multidrug efflux pump subunit AcrA (membrane-fusion protein)
MSIKDNLSSSVVAGLLLFLAGCGGKGEQTEEKIAARTPVTVVGISSVPMAESFELNAVSSFVRKSSLKATGTGTIEAMEVSLGDKVQKGELLFTIRTKESSALARSFTTDTMFAFQGVMRMKASKDGVISSITHQKGDYVQEGDELAVIAEQRSLVFMLEVPFELRGTIRKNGVCDIVLPDKRILQGSISDNLPTMDIGSQTENYLVTPSSVEGLPENLIVKVRIVKVSKVRTSALPKAALLTNETQTEFWVMKLINDTVAVKVPVETGMDGGEKVEIVSPAFAATDRILLTGNYGLGDTAVVSIVKVAAAQGVEAPKHLVNPR